MVYTSNYFNKETKKMIKVRISLTVPSGYTADDAWLDVAPDWKGLLGPHKNGQIDDNEYTRRYIARLDTNANRIIGQYKALLQRHKGKDIVLLCWCGKGKFCHRRLLAEWLGRHGFETPQELH